MSTSQNPNALELSHSLFADLEDATQSLSGALPHWLCATPESDQQTARMLIGAFEESEARPSTSDRRAMFASKRWVIRNQDLALLDSFGTILQGTATLTALAFATGAASMTPLAPAVAILYQLLKTGLVMRKKGVSLDALDFQVLCTLREQPQGLTPSEIREQLADVSQSLDASMVETCLNRLAKYPSRIGDVALVWKGADERWRSKDV